MPNAVMTTWFIYVMAPFVVMFLVHSQVKLLCAGLARLGSSPSADGSAVRFCGASSSFGYQLAVTQPGRVAGHRSRWFKSNPLALFSSTGVGCTYSSSSGRHPRCYPHIARSSASGGETGKHSGIETAD